MNITRGKQQAALKVLIYGPEGIGKSTFAAQFPGAVFIDTEGSTVHMDVARFDTPQKWMDIHNIIDWTLQHPDQVGTLVIDTADWAEKLAIRYVCQEEVVEPKTGMTRNWDSIEAPGYGKGYTYLKTAFQALLDKLSALVAKGVNVVITAHAILKKFEQPDEMGSYDRWALKLNEKNVAPLFKEWADMVLFVNYKTDIVKSENKTNKARGGQKRIMYTQHSACWDAKNRFGLDDPLPFEFGQISHLLTDRAPVPEVNKAEPEPEETPPEAPAAPVSAKAAVEVTGTVPGIASPGTAKKTAKKATTPPARPDTMRSDNPDKDAALETLWGLMIQGGVPDPLALVAVVAEKEYYDTRVKVRDYDLEFIRDVLIEAWDQVLPLCQTKYNNLPF